MARALVNVPTSGVIGEIKASMLTLAQFQAQFGTNWVLADGASATGTKYATLTGAYVLPDCRGVALRGKNNGSTRNPDGDLALGTYQADLYGSHTHAQDAHYHVGGYGNGAGYGGYSYGSTSVGTPNSTQNNNLGHASHARSNPNTTTVTATNQNSGGNETRMKTVTVNYFIKVN